MFKPEEVVALASLVHAKAVDVQLTNQYNISNGGPVQHSYFWCKEMDILQSYVDWMIKAKDLYETREIKFANLTLAEFIDRVRNNVET